MTAQQMQWVLARDQLAAALVQAGYSAELAEIMAKQLILILN